MKKTNTIHFGIQRKIVANMTSESWETIPHVTYMYEPDVTDFMKEYKKLNLNRSGEDKITVNTLMLKVISEGLKAAPLMNSHIHFNRKLVRGEIDTFEDINISMPMILPCLSAVKVLSKDTSNMASLRSVFFARRATSAM